MTFLRKDFNNGDEIIHILNKYFYDFFTKMILVIIIR